MYIKAPFDKSLLYLYSKWKVIDPGRMINRCEYQVGQHVDGLRNLWFQDWINSLSIQMAIYIYMFILYIVYNNNHNDKNHSWNILKYIICHTYTHTVYILHYHYGQFTFLPCYYLKQLWRGGAWYCSCLYTSPKSHLTAKERVECPLRHGKQLIRHGNHQFNGWPNLQCITAITLANILQKGVCESSMTFIS